MQRMKHNLSEIPAATDLLNLIALSNSERRKRSIGTVESFVLSNKTLLIVELKLTWSKVGTLSGVTLAQNPEN